MRKTGWRKMMLILLFACVAMCCIAARGFRENGALQTEEITVTSAALPPSFDGFKIVHLSDLHGARFGEDNCELLRLVKQGEPDIIVITGDIIDDGGDISTALQLCEGAVEIAPTYYVTGNHEARLADASALTEGLKDLGVTVLEDERVAFERGGEAILIGGLVDPAFPDKRDAATRISKISEREGEFLVLLSHRPEMFSEYAEKGVDLVFCGHAHGGQFRVPFIGGLAAPGQGIFPKYDSGLYTEDSTSMIVSRGLGNSVFPFRLGNRPHLVFAVLECE